MALAGLGAVHCAPCSVLRSACGVQYLWCNRIVRCAVLCVMVLCAVRCAPCCLCILVLCTVHCVLCSVLPVHLHLLALPVQAALWGGGGAESQWGRGCLPPCTRSVAEMLPKTSCSPGASP